MKAPAGGIKLNERQRRTLGTMARLDDEEPGRYHGPGYISAQAFPEAPYRQRRDAGMTRTLDSLMNLTPPKDRDAYLVEYDAERYLRPGWGGGSTGRDWRITKAGRELLAALTPSD
jgi:hypothetical protein